MKVLSPTALARFHGERLVDRACLYIRNEGYQAIRNGDGTELCKLIRPIQMLWRLSRAERDKLEQRVWAAARAAKKGFRAAASLASSVEVADRERRLRLQR